MVLLDCRLRLRMAELRRVFKGSAAEKGENLGVSPHPLGTKDFSPYVGKVMGAQPEVLITISIGFDQVNAWKQLREFGAFEKMKVVAALFQPGTIWAVGADVVMGGYGGATFCLEAPETKAISDIFEKGSADAHR